MTGGNGAGAAADKGLGDPPRLLNLPAADLRLWAGTWTRRSRSFVNGRTVSIPHSCFSSHPPNGTLRGIALSSNTRRGEVCLRVQARGCRGADGRGTRAIAENVASNWTWRTREQSRGLLGSRGNGIASPAALSSKRRSSSAMDCNVLSSLLGTRGAWFNAGAVFGDQSRSASVAGP